MAVRLAGLALLVWLTAIEVSPGPHGEHLLVWSLTAAAIPAWTHWMWAPEAPAARKIVVFCWLGLIGGVLASYAPADLVLIGVAALGAATSFDLTQLCWSRRPAQPRSRSSSLPG